MNHEKIAFEPAKEDKDLKSNEYQQIDQQADGYANPAELNNFKNESNTSHSTSKPEENNWQKSLNSNKKEVKKKAIVASIIAAIPNITTPIEFYSKTDTGQETQIIQEQENVIQQENLESGKATLTIGAGGSITSTIAQFLETQAMNSGESKSSSNTILESLQIATDFSVLNSIDGGAYSKVFQGDSIEMEQNADGSWKMTNFSTDNEWQLEPGYLPEVTEETSSEPAGKEKEFTTEQNTYSQKAANESEQNNIREAQEAKEQEAAEEADRVQQELNIEKAEQSVKEMHLRAKITIENLSFFEKISLVNEISKNMDQIIDGDTSGLGSNLQRLMNIYSSGLEKIGDLDSDIHKKTKAEIAKNIRYIGTHSLPEVQAYLS